MAEVVECVSEVSEYKHRKKARVKRSAHCKEVTEDQELQLNASKLGILNEKQSIVPQSKSSDTQTFGGNLTESLNKNVIGEPSTSVPKKKKKKKQSNIQHLPFPPNALMKDISQLQDDVINIDGSTTFEETLHQEPANILGIPSTGKLFIESKASFKAIDKQCLVSKMETTSQNQEIKKQTSSPVDMCLSLDNGVRCLEKYCSGLLSGVSLLQCILVYRIGPPYFSQIDFVEHYSSIAAAIQALFYMLSAVSLFSLCGRVNFESLGSNIIAGVHNLDCSVIALVIYWLCLLLSLSIADKDDGFILCSSNSTLPPLQNDFQVWKNVNLCRCLCAMIGWIILSSVWN